MAPLVRDATSVIVTNQATAVVPAPIFEEDDIVVVVGVGRGSSPVTSPPADFTPLPEGLSRPSPTASDVRGVAYWKPITDAGNEPLSYQIGYGANVFGNAFAVTITGADLADAINQIAWLPDIATDATVDSPSVPTTVDNCLLLRLAAMNSTAASIPAGSWAPTDATVLRDPGQGSSGTRVFGATAYEPTDAAGGTGPETWTTSVDTVGLALGLTIAITPAGQAPPPQSAGAVATVRHRGRPPAFRLPSVPIRQRSGQNMRIPYLRVREGPPAGPPPDGPPGGPDPGDLTHGSQILPDGSNTGFRALGLSEQDLVPSGQIITSQDGQVIEGLHVTGRIRIDHDGVTVRGCLVSASASAYPIELRTGVEPQGLTVELCELHGILTGHDRDAVNGTQNVPAGGVRNVVRRCEMHHITDAGKASGGWSYIENFVHHEVQYPGSHNDGVQVTKAPDDYDPDVSIEILRNRFVMGALDGSAWFGNACVWLRPTSGDIRNVLIDSNWCQASEVTEAIKLRGELDPPNVIDNVAITNNWIVVGWPPAAPGPLRAIAIVEATNITRSGNRLVAPDGSDLGPADT